MSDEGAADHLSDEAGAADHLREERAAADHLRDGAAAADLSDEGGAARPSSEEGAAARRSSDYPFAHASEAELARILDFYAVRWEYEPHTFPILWNLDGDVLESFSPDFYLPDFDLYVELTTLKQRLVRKKNRKLRRLRELYPDIRVKLLYARDFRALMMKYGKLALANELSGTLGQVSSPGRTPEPRSPELRSHDDGTEAPAAQEHRSRPRNGPAPREASQPSADEDLIQPPAPTATISKRANRRRRAARHVVARTTESHDHSATGAT